MAYATTEFSDFPQISHLGFLIGFLPLGGRVNLCQSVSKKLRVISEISIKKNLCQSVKSVVNFSSRLAVLVAKKISVLIFAMWYCHLLKKTVSSVPTVTICAIWHCHIVDRFSQILRNKNPSVIIRAMWYCHLLKNI
jgi:hypothetical protein